MGVCSSGRLSLGGTYTRPLTNFLLTNHRCATTVSGKQNARAHSKGQRGGSGLNGATPKVTCWSSITASTPRDRRMFGYGDLNEVTEVDLNPICVLKRGHQDTDTRRKDNVKRRQSCTSQGEGSQKEPTLPSLRLPASRAGRVGLCVSASCLHYLVLAAQDG